MAELLLEFFSEEIPARMQTRARDDLARLLGDKLKEAGLDFEAMGRRAVSVRGTFSAMAVRGLAGGDPIQRVAKASEDTARHTKRLLQEAQHGGLVFA